MKKTLSKILKIGIPLGLGIFLCWFAYSKFTPEQIQEIKQKFSDVNYFYIGLSVFFGVLSHLARGYRWKYVLNPMGYQPKVPNMFMAVFVGYLMNLTIPRSGEVSRALVLTRYDDVPFDKSFGTIISERLVDFIILMSFTGTVLILQFDLLKNFLLEIIPVEKLLTILGVSGIVLAIFIYWIYRSKHPITYRIAKFFSGLKEGILSIFKLKKVGAFFFYTFFIWLMYLAMFYVAFFALEETSHVSFEVVLTAFVVGSFAITFTNGGFGSYPFFIAEILLIFTIPLTIGTAFGWVMWISQFFMILFFRLLSFVFLPLYNSRFIKEKITNKN